MAASSVEPESCYTACQTLGASAETTYTAIGVDDSGDCICYTEDTFPSTTELVDDDGLNGLCNAECSGDASKSCGSSATPQTAVYSVYGVSVGPAPGGTLHGCYLCVILLTLNFCP